MTEVRKLVWVVVCIMGFTTISILGYANTTVRCIESERQALLNFKKGPIDPYNYLSSWTSGDEDCCRWTGVGCDNHTGHVVMLDVSGIEIMSGNVCSSLLELPYLSHLSLGDNVHGKIPDVIGSLRNLTHLQLTWYSINVTFPYQLGNLTNLQFLSLNIAHNYERDYDYAMRVDSIDWLDSLSSLRELYLSDINFGKAVDLLKSIKLHPSLSILLLLHCQLPETNASSLFHVDPSKSLAALSLINNSFSTPIHSWLFNVSTGVVDLKIQDEQLKGPIPDSFGDMISLVNLDLSHNQLEGSIPPSFKNLCQLKTLDLSHNNLSGPFPLILESLNSLEIITLGQNQISGSIPDITEFQSLREVHLDGNHLDGSFPERFKHFSKLRVLNLAGNQLAGSLPSFSKFSFLIELHVGSNKLDGILSDGHLSELSKLQYLDLSDNLLTLNLTYDWTPSFQLDTIKLRSCKLGPQFPTWLQTQRNFSYLDISNSEISDAIPSWFWNFPSKLRYLNLSFNHIHGQVPNLSTQFYIFPTVDLSSNLFHGHISRFLYNTTALNLSNNMFSGSLSFLCMITDSGLTYLDLSHNMLSGGLPDCWAQLNWLIILNLENNGLSGIIPSSMGSLQSIETLRLRNNSFVGELPSSLKNCSRLKLLDLGENKLTGRVPSWIGESLTNLVVLQLRSNEFHGNIPSTLCRLAFVQVLDISFNNLSGTIPSCLNNLTAMARNQSSDATINYQFFYSYDSWNKNGLWVTSYFSKYDDYASVLWKRMEQKYSQTLGLLKVIDLASNKLIGEIPEEVTSLLGIISLNLSRNNLTGAIPKEIGKLKSLESLDLSRNQLSDKIPTSLAYITFLGTLDLSYNQLIGRIPTSTQLQSFNVSTYLGNPGLCGPPLMNGCAGDEKNQHAQSAGLIGGEEWIDRSSLYAGMGIGFAVGFWGIWGSLLICNSWRRSYFQFLNRVIDSLYLVILLKLAR